MTAKDLKELIDSFEQESIDLSKVEIKFAKENDIFLKDLKAEICYLNSGFAIKFKEFNSALYKF